MVKRVAKKLKTATIILNRESIRIGWHQENGHMSWARRIESKHMSTNLDYSWLLRRYGILVFKLSQQDPKAPAQSSHNLTTKFMTAQTPI
jgi:hypothetical protein